MNYWTDKERRRIAAVEWNEYINNNYKAEINDCIEKTELWDELHNVEYCDVAGEGAESMKALQMTTTQAIKFCCQDGQKVAVLNFASFKNPGGMFLKGSGAQEESLCHESLLYPVLKAFNAKYYAVNHNNLNKALYKDKLLYSTDIPFFDMKTKKPADKVDVITCAAPNWGAYAKYHEPITDADIALNCKMLYSRFKKLYFVAAKHNVDTLILGAWGCGVFKQDINVVINVMFDVITSCPTCIKHIVFAVPDTSSFKIFDNSVRKAIELQKNVQ